MAHITHFQSGINFTPLSGLTSTCHKENQGKGGKEQWDEQPQAQ